MRSLCDLRGLFIAQIRITYFLLLANYGRICVQSCNRRTMPVFFQFVLFPKVGFLYSDMRIILV